VAAAITPRTRAIVPVHLFGNIAPIEELREHGLPVLEDAAQAAGARHHGRPAGSLGDAATVSFFPSKNLDGLGDGGAIVTDSAKTAQRARELRFHGSRDKITFDDVGYNSRLDELQAAVLRVLLPELDGWNASRRAVAAAYEEQGLGELVRLPVTTDGTEHVYHLYVARHDNPDELVAALGEAGVQARGYYRRPVHLQPAMERFGGASLELPATDEIARTNIALPMGPDLTSEQVTEVVEAVRAAAPARA
jgi:dTDP-4-amino-4,6-dideoxygalactose transaminase